jgi:AraC-like DNA-binding protein
MMKKYTYRVFILILMLFLNVIRSYSSADIEYQHFYNETSKYSLKKLKEMGNKYLYESKSDSAIAFYTILCNRYDNSMNNYDKRLCAISYNNMGYVYFYDYGDYYQAYYNYLKALDISEEIGDKMISCTTYLNIANIYQGDDVIRALNIYKQTYKSAILLGNWSLILRSFISMAVTALSIDEGENLIRNEVNSFSHLKIPKTDISRYAICLCKGMKFYYSGQYNKAANSFILASHSIETNISRERDFAMSSFMASKAYCKIKHYDEAANILLTAIECVKKCNANDALCSLYQSLASLYKSAGINDKYKYYRYLWLEKEYEFSNNSRLGKIHDLNSFYKIKKKDEQMKIVNQRHRRIFELFIIIFLFSIIVISLLTHLYIKNKRQKDLFEHLYQKNIEATKAHSENTKRYQGSNLEDKRKQEMLSEIYKVMSTYDEIYQQGFNIDRLSTIIGCSPKYVSQVINELTGLNFNNFLSKYRIEEVCSRLSNDDNYQQLTIEGMAQSIGFKSRSNFNKVFKNITGLTPTEYIKVAKEKKKVHPTNEPME